MAEVIELSSYAFYKIPLHRSPNAFADVAGSSAYPSVKGVVYFYQTEAGVLVVAHIEGLPQGAEDCPSAIFGFHIHESGPCSGTAEEPFANVGSHYNPHNCRHPAHAGDLPPLFGNNGHAFMSVLTNRFTTSEVIGRSVIIHASPDDFTTQPSGNSGAMIACGQILQPQFLHFTMQMEQT
ncbi:MAG TPA: superoxide dismutase family protein [Syntrophomonas sp.]|nr:superoxide dismutase family protein [Syntrophomonas sp.]